MVQPPITMKERAIMTRRMITMNVETREISFVDLTPQELAELQAITDDYHRQFETLHLLKMPVQGDEAVDCDMTTSRTARVAV
jgi:hypothetical protein